MLIIRLLRCYDFMFIGLHFFFEFVNLARGPKSLQKIVISQLDVTLFCNTVIFSKSFIYIIDFI